MTASAGPALLLAAISLFAADPPQPRWVVLNQQARQAITSKDYKTLRDTLAELQPLMPGNARILYNLAAAEAHLGHVEQAMAGIENLVHAGLVYDFAADEDFAALRSAPQFKSLLARMEKNRMAVANATPVQAVPERDLLPEDIAFDAKSKRFLMGSVRTGRILFLDGKAFAKSDWPVMAIRLDPKRRILWAATGWIGHCQACNPADKDKSALLGFNLDSGALLKRIDSPLPGLLGDMTISRSGDLYVSENIHGAVLRLKADSTELERLDTAGEFRSPQTPALSADERTLYVPDYVRGLAAIDLKTRALHWMQPSPGIVLSGIDGFYTYRDSFIAMQNGVHPERVILFAKNLSSQKILEAGTPDLGEVTHGTFVGDTFYFIANTGWDAYDDDGKKKPDVVIGQAQLRKIDLRKLQ